MKMKKVFPGLSLALLLLVAIIATSSANVPGSGWYFGSTFQNIGSGNANVVITAYDSASSNTYTLNQSGLVPGGSFTILPNSAFSPSLPAGFTGSIVASSDQSLAAVVNITNRENTSLGVGVAGGKASALYSGVEGTQTSTTINFPLAKQNLFNKTTTFYLQNTGSAAATIGVTFKVGSSSYPYTSPSVGPGKMVAIDPGLAGVPNGSLGSMTATSAQPIAGIMLEHEHSANPASVVQGSEGFTPSQLDDTVYCPVIKDGFFGRETGLQVQNAHSATQNITVTFQPGNVTSTANNVAPGQSANFFQLSNLPSGLYSAVVRGSAGPVAALVSESELPLVNARQTSTTYNCKAESQATTTVSYPAYKEVYFGRTTGLQIQNVGNTTATNVVVTFQVQGGGTYTTDPQTIGAGSSINLVDVRKNSALWNGAAMGASTLSGVTITSDQPVIAIINEASWSLTGPDNGASSFDKANAVGFNLP